MPTFTIRQTIRDVLEEVQRLRSTPLGGPPSRPGAEELAETLRPPPGQAVPGGIAAKMFTVWGAGAIKNLAVSAGQNQLGFADQAVGAAPSVLVTNNGNVPLDGVVVQFAVSGGGGAITQGRVRTANGGIATLGAWRLGAKGDNTLIATAGNTSVVFAARAVTSLTPTTAITQAARAGTRVPEPPTVKVTDHAGVSLQNVPVAFTVTSGGGKVTQGNVQTDANGIASVAWTLGAAAGTNTVLAAAGPLTVTFTAEAT